MAQAEYAFAQESALFDEQTRVGRVARNNQSPSNAPPQPINAGLPPPSQGEGQSPPPSNPDANDGFKGSPPEADADADLGQPPEGDRQPPPTEPQPVVNYAGLRAAAAGSTFGRPLVGSSQAPIPEAGQPKVSQSTTTAPDLSVLLSLDPNKLDLQQDPTQLQELLQQLKKAEEALETSAQKLRQQATHLNP